LLSHRPGARSHRWTALTRFVDDGRIEAHSKAAERALQGVAIGCKDYLHLGSYNGGHSAAVIYTLIGSAKLLGINSNAYVRHVLEHIADLPSNRIDELLPWAVASELAKICAEELTADRQARRLRASPLAELPACVSSRSKIILWPQAPGVRTKTWTT
jgi:hypothetical protein